jgi:linoleate 10R-lipoxygenase
MLKRFSSHLKRDRKAPNDVVNGDGQAHANGTSSNGTNGVSEKPSRRKSSFGLPLGKEKSVDKETKLEIAANREEVDHIFNEFAQLIHVDNSPVPTPLTDGTNAEGAEPSGLFADLKALGFKDVKTLKELMQNKASGDLVDDKTYIMERIIQVSGTDAAYTRGDNDLIDMFSLSVLCPRTRRPALISPMHSLMSYGTHCSIPH